MTADTTAVLRAELTRRLASYLPPAAIAPVAEEAVQFAAHPDYDADDPIDAGMLAQVALAIVPPQYRLAIEAAGVVAQAVSAWLAARVVEVEAGRVTVTDHRG